jgi:hypothetical protein
MSKIQGVHTPLEIKNLSINGNMDFFQRPTAVSVTVSAVASGAFYSADMWYTSYSGTTNKSFTIARSTNIPTASQSGYQSIFSLQFTNAAAIASLAVTDVFVPFKTVLEGADYAKIHNKTATYGFWFSTTVAGTYSFALQNGAATRSYVTTFAASAGYQFITLSIPMDSVGTPTWAFDNTAGLAVNIAAATGANTQTANLNTWQNGNFLSASGATNYLSTSNATLAIAQVSIVEGPLGFSSTGFIRAGKDIAQELAMCQRYYQIHKGPLYLATDMATSSNSGNAFWKFIVTMRAAPTGSIGSGTVAGSRFYGTTGLSGISSVTPNSAGSNTIDYAGFVFVCVTTGTQYEGGTFALTANDGVTYLAADASL